MQMHKEREREREREREMRESLWKEFWKLQVDKLNFGSVFVVKYIYICINF